MSSLYDRLVPLNRLRETAWLTYNVQEWGEYPIQSNGSESFLSSAQKRESLCCRCVLYSYGYEEHRAARPPPIPCYFNIILAATGRTGWASLSRTTRYVIICKDWTQASTIRILPARCRAIEDSPGSRTRKFNDVINLISRSYEECQVLLITRRRCFLSEVKGGFFQVIEISQYILKK